MCDIYPYYGGGYGCGGCGQCNQCIPVCYDYSVTKLVRPIADASEHAIYPTKEYSTSTAPVISAIQALLCTAPVVPANQTWETLFKTSICCYTSIAQIVPLQDGVTPTDSGAGIWINQLDVYINPQVVAECPRSAEVSVTVTGPSGATLDGGALPTSLFQQSTRTYRPTSNVCFGTLTTTKVSVSFVDADANPVYYNISNSSAISSASTDQLSAVFNIKVRYC